MKISSLPAFFRPHSVDYKSFTLLLRPPFTEENEQQFIQHFEVELNKVLNFITTMQADFAERADELERLSQSKDYSVVEDVKGLKDELRQFVEYVRINVYTMEKILKKHDKKTRYVLRPMYRQRLKHIAHDAEIFDALFYQVSKITLRSGNSEIGKTGSSFIRKTNKYWVPRKNVAALKSMIVRHMPIYVHESAVSEGESSRGKLNLSEPSSFASRSTLSSLDSYQYNKNVDVNIIDGSTSKPSLEIITKPVAKSPFHSWDNKLHDTCVSSVYLDNENFDLYTGRLRKTHGAEAIRIRWYTGNDPNIVFIERKKHMESWTGEKSAKLRFNIDEQHVNDYLLGKNVWKYVAPLNADTENTYVLYNEIQNAIVKQNLKPVVRTFYKRSAFQMPNSAQVRISLDTHLCMIKERSDTFTNWRRIDVGCDFPFSHLRSSEIVRFPHAILEVKLQGEDKPIWVDEIISDSYVEHVEKFSKFMHGCAILYPEINDIPYWLPQCHIDINKDPLNEINSQSPQSAISSQLKMIEVGEKRVSMPIRVEPKVYFANERTFLSWLHFSIFIGGIGTALLGLGDHRAVYSGIVFIITSIIFAVYALYLYFWRANMIRERNPGPYDDLYGPVALVLVFLMAMILSMIFKFPLK